MPSTDKSCQDDVTVEFAKKLKAAGHPIRLRLLCLIDEGNDPCVSDLWKCLDQPQPVISQHLTILKDNGIVSAEVQKTKRVYAIVDPFVKDIVAAVREAESKAAKKEEPKTGKAKGSGKR